MADKSLKFLLNRHIELQRGCYISGVDGGPDGARLIWSERIADFGLNFAIGVTDGNWLKEAAQRRGREPVVLAADMAEARDICMRLNGAPAAAVAWMERPLEVADRQTSEELEIDASAAPTAAFRSVMARLSENEALNQANGDAYEPTLNSATSAPGVSVRHILLRQAGIPAAVASIHAIEGVAGLYNVGVRADMQRRGLGRRITAAAIATAARLDCTSLFLQCLPGGHVEALYASLGFTRVARPLLIALRR